MKHAPNPALRRLYALGAVPSLAQERLDRIAAPLMLVLRDLGDAKILSTPAFEPLLRELDLSGVAREADQVKARDRGLIANSSFRPNKPRSPIEGHDEAGEEQRARLELPTTDQNATARIAEILRTFDSEHTSGGSRRDFRPSSNRPHNGAGERATATGQSPSVVSVGGEPPRVPRNSVGGGQEPKRGGSVTLGGERNGGADSSRREISQQDAVESIRRRAGRAGDGVIADSKLSLNDADPGIVASLNRPPAGSNANARETIAPSRDLIEQKSSAAVEHDSIAMLARVLESLKSHRHRPRTRGPEPREVAAGGANPADQFRSNEAPRSEWSEDAGGLRGLAARVSRRGADALVVARPPQQPSEDDFARLLDTVLRREAGRCGIDLEEIER